MSIKRKNSRGFSLIAPLVTFGIIASLTTFALPPYQDSSIRTKVSEAISAGDPGKLAVEKICQTDPNANVSARHGYRFIASSYVSEVIIGGTCEQPYVELTTQNTGARVTPVVDFVGVYHAGTGEFEWSCTRYRGETRHLPENCLEDSPFL